MDGENKKLVRVYKKVLATQVFVWELPKQEYQQLGKDESGETKYGYVEVPNTTKTEEVEEVLYEQKFDDKDMDVRELTLWANRIK